MAIELSGCVILLQVFDMPTSLRFYRDLLGFRVVERSGPDDRCGWAWLRRGDVEVMLNTAYEDDRRPPQPDPAHLASHDDTTLYFGCPDVDGAHAELRARGIPTGAPTTTRYGMRQLHFHDPDGYGLCLQWKADSPAA